MNMIIAKWGNSLGLRIPSAMAKEVGMKSGGAVRLSVQKGRLVVEPVRDTARYDLDRLVGGINAKNRHSEVETGAPQGDEIW